MAIQDEKLYNDPQIGILAYLFSLCLCVFFYVRYSRHLHDISFGKLV